ncbi:putative DDE superfamily endonuclease [Monocercomonoides exilis]|uniref:putative DDE superfamily endonuclease n=1 Tax=Monocercomonoides exilis TaxID=2049356 RepID=UPI00355968E8|nr:putative DDE superfamily endonuclease [Monocercomonoides exilis]|eukprot:MONOS_15024.1-p1 / transcript=MONOS_15024.1 / gene=MONOS_15024 / organism=Monocercomonoides_exilis_PA203 / gene_product=unspecified product / transcript_product=unspecified product / location=Mono_scaffold01129:2715-4270(+) / protein_length=332 / sequence_SO=supercontig / SO=protein_coding / is_pseudo=false
MDDSLPHRGKAKAINTLEEQLFLLLNVLHHGSCTLTNILASKKLDSQSAIVRLLHSIVSRLRSPLADLFLSFRKDRIESMKDVGIVLDCTVIPTNRPGGRLEYGKKFFSGKHHIYCVKAEVGVNPKVGTASTISAIYSGSTHDYVILKEHYPLFESKLEGSKILADSAYIGARPNLDAIITKPVGTQKLASHRVIVERFFGRMKTLFSIFRKPWIFEIDRIADYFNVACYISQNEKEGALKKKCEEEKKEKRKIEEKEEKDRNETKRIDLEENDSDEDDNSMAWCLPGQWKSIQHSSASSSSPFPSTPRSSEAEKAKRITPSPLRLLLEQRN